MARVEREATAAVDADWQRHWLEWAATQIEASLALDRDATGEVLAALGDLIEGSAASDAAETATRRGAFARVVTAVQVHDRLVQQLTHVAEALRALAQPAAVPATAQRLSELRRRQLAAFTMNEERTLFAAMVPEPCREGAAATPREDVAAATGVAHGAESAAVAGAIELF